MRLPLTPSIGNAIFALAGLLIALMAVLASINTVLSMRVSDSIGAINTTAFPVYSHLARAHVRTLEQSLALRQAAIQSLIGREAAIDGYIAAEARAGEDVEVEITAAREAIAAQARHDVVVEDQVLFGRLQVQLETATRARAAYAGPRARLLAALRIRDGDAIQAALDELDVVRGEQNERFEAARREALAFATKAVDGTQASGRNVIRLTLVMLALAVLLGVLMAFWITRRLVGAVRRLVVATEAIENGDYGADLPVTSRDEIGRLTRAFNLMVAELRLKQKIRDTFGRYLDPQVVASLLDRPEQVAAAGERRRMTILFVDMRGFTRMSEEMTPSVLVTVLNRFFTLLTEPVRAQGGIVDKYLGDGMLAFWGPPFVSDDEQAQRACAAAIGQAAQFEKFRKELPDLVGLRGFHPSLGLRIGLATGDVIAGNIGSAVALNYTVMGDPVNVASRLEGLNRYYGTTILMTSDTAALAGPDVRAREIDRVTVMGRDEPITLHEPARADLPASTFEALAEAYRDGLSAYRSRLWDEAAARFQAALDVVPGDGPSQTMLARIGQFRIEPPPPDWHGSWIAPGK
jgi:class 3 adenylate cyclase